ncbi:hypothetical protein SRHO_G00223580 [Serrasalmus rhombeus]
MEGGLGLGGLQSAELDWNVPNLSKAWKSRKEEFTLCVDMALDTTDEKTKVKGFKYLIGETLKYLITVDYFSNFWEVDHLPDASSATVIHKLKAHFARHGIPDVVVSDNGPQFSSWEFRKFSKAWDFERVTSSPTYPHPQVRQSLQ